MAAVRDLHREQCVIFEYIVCCIYAPGYFTRIYSVHLTVWSPSSDVCPVKIGLIFMRLIGCSHKASAVKFDMRRDEAKVKIVSPVIRASLASRSRRNPLIRPNAFAFIAIMFNATSRHELAMGWL
jgi:hypothetical protein